MGRRVREQDGCVPPESESTASAQPKTGMFVALRTRNYRLWASGQIVSLVGTWMQRVAQDWLVLTLSNGNALAVGIVMALQFGPTLFLSVWGGVLADRYDKRRILIATQVSMALCALVLGLLDVGGLVACGTSTSSRFYSAAHRRSTRRRGSRSRSRWSARSRCPMRSP